LFSIPLTVEETDCLNSIEKILIERLLKICESHIARVVCVGDVHGCITELQDLLRHVGFKPGDLVLLLGDMVAKGPASAQVVQLAREVGAVSVRGNHDYEVIRRVVEELKLEYKKVKSERHAANDNTIGLTNNSEVTGNIPKSQKAVSDHVKIARELSESDIEWLLRLPYYITSPDLGSIFVHAGMLSRTELNKQNPWVMMNMRSATTDGKVSPRCLHHYPWAQHWSGPLTIYFGHDAARGLQIYENAVGLDTGNKILFI
jgi:predicted MPP superfamily phosphohydrolase